MRTRMILVGGLAALVGLVFSLPAQGRSDRARAESIQSYVVVLSADTASAAAVAEEHAQRFGLQLGHVYEHALKGYSALLPAGAVTELVKDGRVESIELDGVVTADTTQTGATWGLDRIDQRNRPLSGTFTYTRTGAGVKAYIIDTGIRFSH